MMKRILLLITLIVSIGVNAQFKKKYAERLSSTAVIDSFYNKLLTDSLFAYSNDAFVSFTLEYYLNNGLPLPTAFSNFHLDADEVYRNFVPRSENTFIPTFNVGLDAGSNDTYAITLSLIPAAYTTGMTIVFRANTANTGAASINVNSLGAKTIVKRVNTTLADNDILSQMYCVLVYNGTNFILINPIVN